ncbi:MAG: hypothetical protein DI629_05225 [Mesorhizobium amorphae]|nr:MAG: hypothetical protein DI629_05225 [Mesorhizobium amorphae]
MRDLAQKWTPVPHWAGARIETDGLSVTTVSVGEQTLVSGDLEAWSHMSGLAAPGVGAFGLAQGQAYTVRLARDRLLAVSAAPLPHARGWHSSGFGVTGMNGGLHVFEVSGPDALRLIERGTSLAPGDRSRSASVPFAGASVILYRHGEALRLHVERPLAPFLWRWMEVTTAAMPGARQ